MIDANALQPLVQVSQSSWNLSLAARQIELARLWADELAKPRNADPKRLLRYGFKIYRRAHPAGSTTTSTSRACSQRNSHRWIEVRLAPDKTSEFIMQTTCWSSLVPRSDDA
jgi:hypothetical protein